MVINAPEKKSKSKVIHSMQRERGRLSKEVCKQPRGGIQRSGPHSSLSQSLSNATRIASTAARWKGKPRFAPPITSNLNLAFASTASSWKLRVTSTRSCALSGTCADEVACNDWVYEAEWDVCRRWICVMEMALEEEACGTRMRMEVCCGRMVMGCGRAFKEEGSGYVHG